MIQKSPKSHVSSPHAFAYSMALAIVAAIGLIGAIVAALIFADGSDKTEMMMYIAFGASIPIRLLTEKLLLQPINGAQLSGFWRDKLSTAISAGAIFGILTAQYASGLWPILTQVIGGWVVCTVFFLTGDLLWDWAWARFKQWRKQATSDRD